MSNRFVISDTHYNHTRILTFLDAFGEPVRRFPSIEVMNETMITNWNKTVGKRDIVYHLGDVLFGLEKDGINILRRLNGRKKLILGNHDKLTPELMAMFEDVELWKKSHGDGMILSHMPLNSSVLMEATKQHNHVINIHGHIHEKESPAKVQYRDYTFQWRNVSVERIDYTPVAIDDILKSKRGH